MRGERGTISVLFVFRFRATPASRNAGCERYDPLPTEKVVKQMWRVARGCAAAAVSLWRQSAARWRRV